MALPLERSTELLTARELFHRSDLEPCELVDGRVVRMSPTGFVHGDIESELVVHLRAYAKRTGRGRVVAGEVGIIIRRDPDTVRAADVLFISHERLARSKTTGYLDVAPELVVEVLSPDDRWSEVTEKLGDDFAAGVERAWVVDPRLRKLFAFHSLAEVETFAEGQTLRDDALLPGFELVVADLFGETGGEVRPR